MVNFCAVVGCSNRAGPGVNKSFYRIPAVINNQGEQTQTLSAERQREWLGSLCRADLKTNCLSQYRVCSDHFITGSPAKLYDRTNPDWVPTVKMGHEKFNTASNKNGSDRFKRTTRRAENRNKFEVAKCLLELQSCAVTSTENETVAAPNIENDLESTEPNNIAHCGTQTDLTQVYIESLQKELQRLTTENLQLKEALSSHSFTSETFKNNDDKVKYFTGLPNFMMLMAVYNLVSPSLSQTSRSSLNKFQQILLTLMRLRLSLPMTLLSYLFRVSPSTISRTYANVIDVMYDELECLIKWPEREDLRKTMPMDFRKHFKTKVAVIIDCFEIFVERPSNLKARALTWSSYKHNNTVEYLIGIIPQGAICYISSGWGGRVSDKHLTEHCDILSKLLPGDIVLADRGFDIADSVGSVCGKLIIPAFTRGKSQLSALEVENTRKIGNVRIHVERVIGNLRQKYTFFDGAIPVDHLICPPGDIPMLDKELVVCCALINLNDSVVPFH